MNPHEVTLEAALKLLSLPREVGKHPADGEPITAALGRFGPYIKHGKNFRSVAADEDVLTIGLNRAVSLLAEPRQPGRGRAAPLRVVGEHPADKAPINLYKGRYGAYVAHDGINATIPRDITPEELTLEQAVELLAARAAQGGGSKKPTRTRKKASAPVGEPKSAPDASKRAAKGTKNAKKTAAKRAAKGKQAAD
jgi:DNA topoisomerase-1